MSLSLSSGDDTVSLPTVTTTLPATTSYQPGHLNLSLTPVFNSSGTVLRNSPGWGLLSTTFTTSYTSTSATVVSVNISTRPATLAVASGSCYFNQPCELSCQQGGAAAGGMLLAVASQAAGSVHYDARSASYYSTTKGSRVLPLGNLSASASSFSFVPQGSGMTAGQWVVSMIRARAVVVISKFARPTLTNQACVYHM